MRLLRSASRSGIGRCHRKPLLATVFVAWVSSLVRLLLPLFSIGIFRASYALHMRFLRRPSGLGRLPLGSPRQGLFPAPRNKKKPTRSNPSELCTSMSAEFLPQNSRRQRESTTCTCGLLLFLFHLRVEVVEIMTHCSCHFSIEPAYACACS